MELFNILEQCPKNKTIIDNVTKAYSKINSPLYKRIICSISGGADSDVMLDICSKCDKDNKIDYIWFDTGLEYEATKKHLKYLEDKYGINIKTYKAIKPIPNTCKEYGQPFISKKISDNISRLQKYNFKWEDKSFEELYKEYPKCKSALRWWCNAWGENSRFNINKTKYLKEFMIANPPWFKISHKCCQFAKKDVIHKCISDNSYDLNIYGVRKSEGGARATAYKNCFTSKSDSNKSYAEYRPIFYYTNQDKIDYENQFNILHSKCYTEYGLKRTGCAGCPFGKDFEFELNVIQKYEPKLYKAVNNIFGDSYKYTRMYNDFKKKCKGEN